MGLPLEGIKVIDASSFVAAPMCTRMLCDFGADVIKIESFSGDAWRVTAKNLTRTGDDENPIYDILNSGKKSVQINLKNPDGMALLHTLLRDADVFVTNTRLKSLQKLQIDPQSLCGRYPRLIYAAMTGFGEKGPLSADPGFDNVAFWGESGFLADMAIDAPGAYPVDGPVGVGDSISGIALLSGVLAALYQRESTGRGDYVSVSLYNTALWVMNGMTIGGQERYGAPYPRKRSDCWVTNAPYRCADGEWINITILEYDRYAAAFYEALGVQDAAQSLGVSSFEAMLRCREQLFPVIEAAFLKRSAAQWLEVFRAKNIVCGVLKRFRDAEKSEQAWANQYVEKIGYPGGDVVFPCPPVRLGSQGIFRSKPASAPGADTADVLRAHGCREEDIARLAQTGAVKAPGGLCTAEE